MSGLIELRWKELCLLYHMIGLQLGKCSAWLRRYAVWNWKRVLAVHTRAAEVWYHDGRQYARLVQTAACLFTCAKMWKLYCKSSSVKPHMSVFSWLYAVLLPSERGILQKSELQKLVLHDKTRDLCKKCGIECNHMQLQERHYKFFFSHVP